MKYPARLLKTCPHCDWCGFIDRLELEVDKHGVRIDFQTKWQCPSCKMIVHYDDKDIEDE